MPDPTIRSQSTAAVGSVASYSPSAGSLPAGIVTGDLLMAFGATQNNVTVPVPGGWSRRATATGGSGIMLFCDTKTATGTNGSDLPTWTADFAVEWAFTFFAIQVATFNAGNPIDGTSVSAEAVASGSTVPVPAVVPVTARDLLLGAFSDWDGSSAVTSMTPPAGMTELADLASGVGHIILETAKEQLVNAGSTGSRTATLVGSTSQYRAGMLVVIRNIFAGGPRMVV